MNRLAGKDLEGSGYGLIEILFRNLPEGTEENNEELVRTVGVQPRFEQSASSLQRSPYKSLFDYSMEFISYSHTVEKV